MIETAPLMPVTESSRLHDTLRKVKNTQAFLEGVSVTAASAPVLLECLGMLGAMEVRIGQDIATAEG